MPEPKVIVVGSLHYDIMVSAPDRPRRGETVLGDAWWPKCGGKGGNQAVEAALAGGTAVMVGAVGDDDFGVALLAHLRRAGVDASAVAVVPGAASGMSVAILDAAGDYGAVVISGVNRAIGVTDETASGWQSGDWLVLQNEVPAAVNLDAALLAHRRGLRVLLNAAPALPLDTELAAMIDVLVVNAIQRDVERGGGFGSWDRHHRRRPLAQHGRHRGGDFRRRRRRLCRAGWPRSSCGRSGHGAVDPWRRRLFHRRARRRLGWRPAAGGCHPARGCRRRPPGVARRRGAGRPLRRGGSAARGVAISQSGEERKGRPRAPQGRFEGKRSSGCVAGVRQAARDKGDCRALDSLFRGIGSRESRATAVG